MKISSLHKQRGVSLVELMVGLVAGLIVIGGVTSVYLTTIVSSANTLKQSKLNQEMTTLMSVMAADIRRAGVWQTGIDYQAPQDNPYAQFNNTALEVFAANSDATSAGPQGSGVCIVYAYDAFAGSNSLEATDLRGFRLNGNVVEMRQQGDPASGGGNLCNDANDTWAAITDNNVINITSLSFDLASSSCINTREPDGINNDGDAITNDEADEQDCYRTYAGVTNTGDITVETRYVDISLSGQLTSDSSVKLSMNQSVRVRNDLVRIR